MRTLLISLFLFLCWLEVQLPINNQLFAYIGSNAVPLLDLPVSARATGIGGAYTSIANDPSAIYWNPAGLGSVKHYSIITDNTITSSGKWSMLNDVAPSYMFFSASIPMKKYGTVGFGIINSKIGDIDIRGSSEYHPSLGFAEYSENAYIFSFGKEIFENGFSIGTSIKYVRNDFNFPDKYGKDANASGIGLDFGVIYIPIQYIKIGALSNTSFSLKWNNNNSHKDNVPKKGKVGIAIIPVQTLIFAIDLVQIESRPLELHSGCEYTYKPSYLKTTSGVGLSQLSIRLGMDGRYIEERYGRVDLNKELNLNWGIGTKVDLIKTSLSFDYSMGFYRLGTKNKFTFGVEF